MKKILDAMRQELTMLADDNTRISGERFFKEAVNLYGVKTAIVTALGKKYFNEVGHLPKQEVFLLCEELWKSNYMEESFIACNWSYAMKMQFAPDDFEIFRRWIDTYVSNWASCDTFCNHTLGEFIIRYPSYLASLKEFTLSENRWMRRAAAVSLIVPARKGMFLSEIIDISDSLLLDKDDLVQKGYGWMLKVASQVYQQAIFDYVMKNKTLMPRTALRYAIEKMPADLKAIAMRK
ncbi:MAG: DNA alkylation repair protein [Bacteroidota bacterium]|nr:MAG: DNA alkylation repair protein [Bacteroidota bacterium]